jgi:hypothetical protein
VLQHFRPASTPGKPCWDNTVVSKPGHVTHKPTHRGPRNAELSIDLPAPRRASYPAASWWIRSAVKKRLRSRIKHRLRSRISSRIRKASFFAASFAVSCMCCGWNSISSGSGSGSASSSCPRSQRLPPPLLLASPSRTKPLHLPMKKPIVEMVAPSAPSSSGSNPCTSVRNRQLGPEFGPSSAFYSCVPA